jgi:hypothetical protein
MEVAGQVGAGFDLPKIEKVGLFIALTKMEVVIAFENSGENLAPRARFELATLRLTAECSTIELPGNRATCLFSL